MCPVYLTPHIHRSNINVDIGYNNLLAVHNTQLLYTYSLIDERVKELVMLVKLWARRRFINDTYSGTLSSYAYVVMVIHFLQSACHPPVLPVLQTLGFSEGQPRKTIIIDDGQTFDVDFFRDIQHLDQVWPYAGRNQDSVGKLFYLFLHYWAHEFEYRRFVASIRETRLLTKAQKDWVPMIERKAKADDSETVVHVDDVGESPKVAVKNVADAIGAVSPVVVGNVSAPVADEGDVVQEDADESKPKPRLQRYWVCDG